MRPQPGMMPTRAWVSAKRARSDATRKSQASASSKPPVMATPLMAPITGVSMSGNGPAGGARLAGGRGLAQGVAAGGELLEVEPGAERRVGTGEDDGGDVVALVELDAARWGSPCAGRGSARCGHRGG